MGSHPDLVDKIGDTRGYEHGYYGVQWILSTMKLGFIYLRSTDLQSIGRQMTSYMF